MGAEQVRAGPERLWVGTTPGLEPALLEECRALDASARLEDGGVVLEGEAGLHMEACLRLSTATSLRLSIAEVTARDEVALRRALGQRSLSRFWDGRSPIGLSVHAAGSRLDGSAVRRAFEAAFGIEGKTQGVRESDEEEPGDDGTLRLVLRARGETSTLAVDCAGGALFRRGYRQEVSRAPLRETLAAGILRLAGYSGDEPLWDPMCGSGTLLIEAALVAQRRAPGLLRGFAFQRWPSHDEERCARVRRDLEARARSTPPAPLWGSDLNSGSLGVARRNARRAGVLEWVRLWRADATRLEPPEEAAAGLLVANLPYGVRVGEQGELRALYRDFGSALRARLPGWRCALLVEASGPRDALGLSAPRELPLRNGGLRCVLLQGTLGE